MNDADLGGESPCYAHLLEPPPTDLETRGDIERLVRDFYRQAAMDDVLGPVFAAAHVDWPSHIGTLTDFWAWQLLGEPGYDGNPLRAHDPAQTTARRASPTSTIELDHDVHRRSNHGNCG